MAHPARITCKVFGCERWTRKYEGGEMICRDHWRTVPRDMRANFHKAKRSMLKKPTTKNIKRQERWWRRCIRHADAVQFGIG